MDQEAVWRAFESDKLCEYLDRNGRWQSVSITGVSPNSSGTFSVRLLRNPLPSGVNPIIILTEDEVGERLREASSMS